MILVRSSRNTWTAGSSVCWGWMMPRSQSWSALSSLCSFPAMREMVSGSSICCPKRAVQGAVLPPAAAAGTTWRFPRSSPAFFSAFSILLMSKHSQQTHDGERRRKGKCDRNNQRKYPQFPTQTCQLPWAPQVRHDCRHRHLVPLGYRVRETHVRIESQPSEKEPEGNQNPEHYTPEHELPESRRIRGRPRCGWFQDFEIRSLPIAVHVYRNSRPLTPV